MFPQRQQLLVHRLRRRERTNGSGTEDNLSTQLMLILLFSITECSADWTQYKSFCYKASSLRLSWEDARQACLDIHADLASIASSAENSFINTTLIPGKGGHWIGLNDKEQEGVLQWSDGTPYNFSSFGADDTNIGNVSNCVLFNSGEWSDKECFRGRRYICEKRGKQTSDKTTLKYLLYPVLHVFLTPPCLVKFKSTCFCHHIVATWPSDLGLLTRNPEVLGSNSPSRH